MKIRSIVNSVESFLKSNSTTILTAFGVSGVVSTAYLVGKASFAAANVIREEEETVGAIVGTKEKIKEYTPLVWKLYVPAGVCGAATIGCIIGAQRIGSKKTAAAQAAFSITERAFSEYREKVVEHIGKGKEQKIRDELAQERITKNPPGHPVIVNGNVLCCELHTGRYFMCDMETLRRAQNTTNHIIIRDDYATLDDFYHEIGLPKTDHSNDIGWKVGRLLELEFTTALTEDGKPCLAFAYNYTKPL